MPDTFSTDSSELDGLTDGTDGGLDNLSMGVCYLHSSTKICQTLFFSKLQQDMRNFLTIQSRHFANTSNRLALQNVFLEVTFLGSESIWCAKVIFLGDPSVKN